MASFNELLDNPETFEQKRAKWFDKMRTWVPQCVWFENVQSQDIADPETWEGINVATFQGFAAIMAQIECTLIDHVRETYICKASGAYIDEHGIERNVQRTLNELDVTYRERIKNITNSTSCPSIKDLVDALLTTGESIILEDFNANLFFDRENFFNRGEIFVDPIYNAFTIIVDKQVHEPYSFFDREYFMDREDFIGQQDSRIELFEIIVEAVNAAKALGTVYRVVERLV